MKKTAIKVLTATLCVGVAASFMAFSACDLFGGGRSQLIEGDFSTEATQEQKTEVGEMLSGITEDSFFADATSGGNTRAFRTLSNGTLVASAALTMSGQTMNMDMSYDYNMDHVMNVTNTNGALAYQGSGTAEYKMDVYASAAGQVIQDVEGSIQGTIYNDNDYLYLNGLVTAVSADGQTATQRGKYKYAFKTFYEQLSGQNIGAGLSDFYDLLELEGTKVYVDDGDTLKVKISVDKNGLAEAYSNIFAGLDIPSTSVSVSEDDFNFTCYDIYVEFDKTTNSLIGYGTDVDAAFVLDVNIMGAVGIMPMDVDSYTWVVVTDEAPDPLPADLDSYVLAG